MSERPERAAFYARVSSEEQREAKTIGMQTEFQARWLELHGKPAATLYLDDGVTGTLPLEARPEGARLLADARARRWEILYVHMLDRLGRHPRHILNGVAALEESGCRVVSMTEPFDTATPAGRLMLTMLSAIAGFARDVLIERSMEGRYTKAGNGVWVGGPAPYGYRLAERWLIPNEEPGPGEWLAPAAVIRLIYQRLAEGGTCFRVAEELQALGVPTPNRAAHWRASMVHALAKSSVYRGEYQYGKAGQHQRPIRSVPAPPLVEAAPWHQAQEQLRRNLKKAPGNTTRSYLLRGLLKCHLCGLTYCGFPVQRGIYYRCRGKYKDRGQTLGEKCPSPHVPQSVEAAIWEDVQGILLDPAAVLQELAKLRECPSAASDPAADLARIEQALQAHAERRARAIDLYVRGLINPDEMETQLAGLQRETTALQLQQQRLRGPSAPAAELASVEAMLATLRERLTGDVTPAQQRALIEELVEGGEVRQGEGKAIHLAVRYRVLVSRMSEALTVPGCSTNLTLTREWVYARGRWRRG